MTGWWGSTGFEALAKVEGFVMKIKDTVAKSVPDEPVATADLEALLIIIRAMADTYRFPEDMHESAHALLRKLRTDLVKQLNGDQDFLQGEATKACRHEKPALWLEAMRYVRKCIPSIVLATETLCSPSDMQVPCACSFGCVGRGP